MAHNDGVLIRQGKRQTANSNQQTSDISTSVASRESRVATGLACRMSHVALGHLSHLPSSAFEQQVATGTGLNLSNGGEGKGSGSRDNTTTHNMLIKGDNI
jgi:hypothetical protein